MEGKSLTILVISALLMLALLAGCAPSQTGEAEVQGGQEAQEVQEKQDEQVPEIWNEKTQKLHTGSVRPISAG